MREFTPHPIQGVFSLNKTKLIVRARTYSQYCKMVEDAIAGRCPFCQLDRVHNDVKIDTPNWRVWPCNPPEKNTQLHYLIVPVRHIVRRHELNDTERRELWGSNGIMDSVDNKYCGNMSCGILIRDGAPDLAGTIEHWHMHVMVPNGTGRVESPIYKGYEDDNASATRAVIYEKVRMAGGNSDNLTDDERQLVKGRGVPGVE